MYDYSRLDRKAQAGIARSQRAEEYHLPKYKPSHRKLYKRGVYAECLDPMDFETISTPIWDTQYGLAIISQ